jgi:uncharacterized glyoxalase superfamily protein PhnB
MDSTIRSSAGGRDEQPPRARSVTANHELKCRGHAGVIAPKPPQMQPWGIVVCYVVDPTGVLWHFVPATA